MNPLVYPLKEFININSGKGNNSNNNNNINNVNNNGKDDKNHDEKYDKLKVQNNRYVFPKKGLRNIGTTCYMNATLQCLLHVSDLVVYFIDEYPKDQKTLLDINKTAPTRGELSRAFYNLVKGVCESENNMLKSKKLNPSTDNKGFNSNFNFLGLFNNDRKYNNNSYSNEFSPDEFKRTLGLHNPQFRNFEANDSKDLILYLLQTLHEELNYFGNKNQRLKFLPNQYDLYQTYTHFFSNYNANNFSKISLLFYGTYINITKCLKCNKVLYNFQKFEFISFGMYYYNRRTFNLIDGFKDNSKTGRLTGDNKFFCNFCNKLQEAETTCKIFEPPKYLLINIDYGKNKIYQPSSIEFDDIIDITKFVSFDYKQKIKYQISGVCTHYGYSGRYGHYVAFCKNRENKWYEFNDSSCYECKKSDANRGSPYLLLYERIFE